jgi:hypothetical protein
MKIEIGESLMYSWMRHIKLCELAQTNWKASEKWVRKHDTELQKLKDEVDALFPNLNIFGKTKKVSLDQYFAQAEIDVIGLSLLNNKIYAVDIAFHENGLGYGKIDENLARVIKKSLRSAMNVYGYYDRKDAEIIFATPKASPKLLNKLQQSINDLQSLTKKLGYNFDFKIIVNDDFFSQILEPIIAIIDDIKDTNELFIRSCKMLAMQYKISSKTANATKKITSVSNGSNARFIINGKPCTAYRMITLEAMKIYVANNPDLTANEIVANWAPLKVVSYQVETDTDHQDRKRKSQKKDFDSKSFEVKLPRGGSVFVSNNQFTESKFKELADNINQQRWGITISW